MEKFINLPEPSDPKLIAGKASDVPAHRTKSDMRAILTAAI
jgi:hypothetical protein